MVNTIFHLENVEVLLALSSISHTLGELDPREEEKEKHDGPVEELESIKLDDQHRDGHSPNRIAAAWRPSVLAHQLP